jgi:hypothetical protein
MSAVTVADHRFRRRLRAGPAHLLRHRRDRHTPPDRRLGHQTTDLPGPPPARAGTGNGNGHRTDALSTPPRRQATCSPVTRHFRLRSQSRHGPLPAAGRPPDARDTDWSIPVIAGAGSVLARMFRYSAALSGARRHPPSRPPLPAGHWKGLSGGLPVVGIFRPKLPRTGHRPGDSRSAFPQAGPLGRAASPLRAIPIRRSGRSLLTSGRC